MSTETVVWLCILYELPGSAGHYASPVQTLTQNVILSAGILHDIGRYGLGDTPSQYTLPEHPDIGASFLRGFGGDGLVEEVACAVETHSGRWGRIQPRNETEWLVHYADCIAANYQEWSSR